MLIIPVIDLMGGKVVHARGGQREQYLPIKSQLTSSVYPHAVIKQLLTWFSFPVIYIADLDAIENGSIDKAFYLQLHTLFPQLTIWLDAGIRNLDDWLIWHELPNIKPVLGSESLEDEDLLGELQKTEFILSLDFRKGSLLGHYDLLEHSDLWPDTIIVMSLDSVGSEAGPDKQLLKKINELKPEAKLMAAGGVRGEEDLLDLAGIGTNGALVASALHKGKLSVNAIRQIMN
ncbi:MAG TPA: hypothetical protein DCQ49_10160 [Methylophaga sp.]|uniref:HisA/HisF-related TIM barrel protein n=1 Tax=unclassified Methylophaga TaxID=2629249 RepID=UPI000C98A930|nr:MULTISPECIES: HisA/HisF-related TIM barrel protein [unclassified Methylophaga]MAK66813.1 hypothetical protein [Methylophaga sp.]MBN47081.1 hypothetical protein [Methylophaga sp.]HAO25432.1 hypothetical protein [Methylophaga sp.]